MDFKNVNPINMDQIHNECVYTKQLPNGRLIHSTQPTINLSVLGGGDQIDGLILRTVREVRGTSV